MSKKNRTTWYVCGTCGNENVSYQVWVDENVRLSPNYYVNTKTNGDDIDWQVAYAMNGQAWCEEDEELGTDRACSLGLGPLGPGVRAQKWQQQC